MIVVTSEGNVHTQTAITYGQNQNRKTTESWS